MGRKAWEGLYFFYSMIAVSSQFLYIACWRLHVIGWKLQTTCDITQVFEQLAALASE